MNATNTIVDLGTPDQHVIVAGMGRSGTTWLAQIINHDESYRIVHEPFLPTRVSQASDFRYCQYLAPEQSDERLAQGACEILAGIPHNDWVDQCCVPKTYHRRIIKDIRCNLMLSWLRQLSGQPLVLIVRHPLQVAHSWLRLGWGKEVDTNRQVLDAITSQSELLNDFPVIEELAQQVDAKDILLRTVFLWCVFHYVPRQQLLPGDAHVVFYESLLADGESHSASLFNYLHVPWEEANFNRAWQHPSATNFLQRDFEAKGTPMLNGWKSFFSPTQISQANDLIAAFGLEDLYDADGMPAGVPFLSQSPSG